MTIYLDYNATAPLSLRAKEAMQEGMTFLGNASSVHQFGREVRKKIEEARCVVSQYFKCQPADIIFTSGATEANHLALCGFEGPVVVSAIEHDSVDQARADRFVCPVDTQGVINLDALETFLKKSTKPILVSVMAANNETGILQPLDQVVELAKRYGALIHCDAVQAIGRLPLSWNGIDLISVSAHKFGGPQGVGALVMRTNVTLKAQLRGGGQERAYRSGTENFLGIIGFAAALQEIQEQDWSIVKELRDTLEQRLQSQCPDAILIGSDNPRIPNTSVIAMRGVKNATQVMNFDLAGIALSAGSACSSGKVKSSKVLAAMNVPADIADCAIRVSFGPTNTQDHIDQFVKVWADISERASHKNDHLKLMRVA